MQLYNRQLDWLQYLFNCMYLTCESIQNAALVHTYYTVPYDVCTIPIRVLPSAVQIQPNLTITPHTGSEHTPLVGYAVFLDYRKVIESLVLPGGPRREGKNVVSLSVDLF